MAGGGRFASSSQANAVLSGVCGPPAKTIMIVDARFVSMGAAVGGGVVIGYELWVIGGDDSMERGAGGRR